MASNLKSAMTLSERCTTSLLSRGAIAQTVGVSRQTLWHWEHGGKIEKVDQIHALAKVFDCKITDLNPDLLDVL